jgi:hypothetical protein
MVSDSRFLFEYYILPCIGGIKKFKRLKVHSNSRLRQRSSIDEVLRKTEEINFAKVFSGQELSTDIELYFIATMEAH